MRALLIAIALLAVGCGTAVAQSPPAPADRPRSTISFSSVESDAAAEIESGLGCVGSRKEYWASGGRFSDSRYSRAFREAMVAGGFTMTGGDGPGVAPGGSSAPDLQVGALVRSVRLKACTSFSGSERRATLEVEWRIYSSGERKLISKLYSTGDYAGDARAPELVDSLLTSAFKRAAEDLANKKAFLRLVKGDPPDPVRPSAAPVPSLASLSISVPAAHGTAITLAPFAVVSVVVSSGHGSGVLISPDGYVLTNRHVAGDAGGKVRVVWADGSEAPGQVLRADRKRDVALVKVDVARARPLAIRHDPPLLGETVFAIGTPLDKRLAGTLTKGIVSAVRVIDGQPFIQSDVVVNHGNSGGPLLDEQGQLIGLTVSGLEVAGAPTGINFFIPIDDALKVLALTPRTIAAAPPPPRPAAHPPARKRAGGR